MDGALMGAGSLWPYDGEGKGSLADWLGQTLFALPVWVVFFSLHVNGFVPFID